MPTPAGFVGYTLRGPTSPCLVTSWDEFLLIYGDAPESYSAYLWYAVRGFFENGGRFAYISRVLGADATCATLRIPTIDKNQALIVEACTPGTWGNDLNVKVTNGTRTGTRIIVSFSDAVKSHPGFAADNLGLDPDGPNHILDMVSARVTGLVFSYWADYSFGPAEPQVGTFKLTGGTDGARSTVVDFVGVPASEYSGARGLEALGSETVGLICVPECVNPTLDPKVRHALTLAVIKHCEHHGDRFAIFATEPMLSGASSIQPPLDTRFGAMYGPWVSIESSPGGEVVLVPAVGHIVGIYARHDAAYGVHSAPANEMIRGLACSYNDRSQLEISISENEQEMLIEKGVNGIRLIAGSCTEAVLDSAVTMSVDYRWRYVNVVRLLMFVTQTLASETNFVSPKPHNEATWSLVRAKAETFLSKVWQDGALLGRTTEEAFFVRCDRETMTEDDISCGRLVYLVGLCLAAPPVRVMIELQQSMGNEHELTSQHHTKWRWIMDPQELSPSRGIRVLVHQEHDGEVGRQ